MPYRHQMALGKWMGHVAHSLAKKRRAIARRNIELCFPELDAAARDQLALDHFKALGISLMELGQARWLSDEKLFPMFSITGLENLTREVDAGHGVIVLSAHFTTLDVTGRALCAGLPAVDLVYRKFANGLMTEFVAQSREMFARQLIEKNDIKTMVRSLRDGNIVWYAPDQGYHLNQSKLVPFFGIPAMSNAATSSLARLGKARVVPYFPRRLAEGGYELCFLPALQNFPSNDPVADTRQFHAVLEEHIRSCPEQYYWVHRRFKNRPDDLPNVYANLEALK